MLAGIWLEPKKLSGQVLVEFILKLDNIFPFIDAAAAAELMQFFGFSTFRTYSDTWSCKSVMCSSLPGSGT